METLLSCLGLVLVFECLRKGAEAVHNKELDRFFIAYNPAHDKCSEITDHSQSETKRAADEECDRTFRALDDLRLNICHGWRQAACRVVPGDQYQHYQCTCMISYCDDISVKSNIVTPLRNCASVIRGHEASGGQAIAPTTNFRQVRSRYDKPAQGAQLRRAYASYGRYGETGSSSGINTSGGAGSSLSVIPLGGPAGSTGTFTSEYAYPSSAYHSYAPGTTPGEMSELHPVRAPAAHGCDQCNGRFRSVRALFDHKRIHHTVSDTYCYTCNIPYNKRKSFLDHLRRRHPELAKEEVASQRLSLPGTEEVMPYACPVCQRRFSLPKSVIYHMKSHTTDDTKCRPCNKTFSTRTSFKIHMRNTHPNDPIPPPAEGPARKRSRAGPFACGDCRKTYFTGNSLRRHQEAHKSPDTYCFFCKKPFGTKITYERHMKKKHSEKSINETEAHIEGKCEECGEIYKNQRSLRDHQKFHEGKTTCQKCNKVFPRASGLTKHKRNEH